MVNARDKTQLPRRLPDDELAALAGTERGPHGSRDFSYERGAAANGVFVVLRGRVVLKNRISAGRALRQFERLGNRQRRDFGHAGLR